MQVWVVDLQRHVDGLWDDVRRPTNWTVFLRQQQWMGPPLCLPSEKHSYSLMLQRSVPRPDVHIARAPEDVLLHIQHYSTVYHAVDTNPANILAATDFRREDNTGFVSVPGFLYVHVVDCGGSSSYVRSSTSDRWGFKQNDWNFRRKCLMQVELIESKTLANCYYLAITCRRRIWHKSLLGFLCFSSSRLCSTSIIPWRNMYIIM